MAGLYSPGGQHWNSVVRVAQACGCKHEQAVAALKVCDNVEEAAISCLSDPWLQLESEHSTPHTSNHNEDSDKPIPPDPCSDKQRAVSDYEGLQSYDAEEVIISSELGSFVVPPVDGLHTVGSSGLEAVAPALIWNGQPATPLEAADATELNTTPDSMELNTDIPSRPSARRVLQTLPSLGHAPYQEPRSKSAARRTPAIPGLILPVLTSTQPPRRFNPREGLHLPFSVRRLVFALQKEQISYNQILTYFSYFEAGVVSGGLDESVQGIPAIFYAVATNDETVVRMWIEHGADVNVSEQKSRIPLLAFAILQSSILRADTTPIVVTLLSLGADVSIIPKAFYSPFLQEYSTSGPNLSELSDLEDDNKKWCTEYIRPQLATALNLTQRYVLEKHERRKKPALRLRHAAARLNVTSLFSLPYFMIGQDFATQLLTEELISYLITQSEGPLILFFAGPSGHGKSELGKLLGKLLSLEILTVDMAGMKFETDLFGPRPPYQGHERGSPLNNFLSHRSGRRAIIFLDEFERSSTEVRDTLLIPFGEDRRNEQQVDCSKVIWVLASNALDSIIMDSHERGCLASGSEDQKAKQINGLQSRLLAGLRSKFGFPLAGRISSIIPFLPFSNEEQAVIAHKYLLQLAENVRSPVSQKRLIGNITLQFRHDAALCKSLASNSYHVDTGARSLESAVTRRVKNALVQQYLDRNSAINEQQPVEEYFVEVDKEGQISVFRSQVEHS
ncbi:MAG: hypothetical protein M1840_005246 [Geoglossum simile]|nr:MAG: hypothetical protein M1840_005246 [Geoglossum simile]